MASLWDAISGRGADQFLSTTRESVAPAALARETTLGESLPELAGLSVLVAPDRQLATALALIELDGLAARLLLCPPDLAEAHLPALIATAGIDAVIAEDAGRWEALGIRFVVRPRTQLRSSRIRARSRATQWLLLTSGTSGTPKIVAHDLATLTAAIRAEKSEPAPPFWGTFYDIRRYGGLQILLRALLSGGSLVLSEPNETTRAHLERLAHHGVTHVSGTPSHWRKVLASAPVEGFAPRVIRLSGEIADQAVLDGLARAFPHAAIGHAYASTEAGVGFLVTDGREGFPAALVDEPAGDVNLCVVDGALRVRSAGAGFGYVGASETLRDGKDFFDTGDMVERRADRFHFVGRRGGIINVGGLKVHPEEVEAVINRHPGVLLSRVVARKSPITGAVVAAEIVVDRSLDEARAALIREEVKETCRRALEPHKRPAIVTVVPSLDVTAAGKLARAHA